eukprot:3030847-Ditylum_brightwellii.AAC.1
MSRTKLRKIFHSKFPHLVPLFDILYCKANKVYFHPSDGTLDLIYQVEGYAQGCPLSAVFAALVLGELLQDIDKDLLLCCKSRLNQIDCGFSESAGFIGDVSNCLLHEDVY